MLLVIYLFFFCFCSAWCSPFEFAQRLYYVRIKGTWWRPHNRKTFRIDRDELPNHGETPVKTSNGFFVCTIIITTTTIVCAACRTELCVCVSFFGDAVLRSMTSVLMQKVRKPTLHYYVTYYVIQCKLKE